MKLGNGLDAAHEISPLPQLAATVPGPSVPRPTRTEGVMEGGSSAGEGGGQKGKGRPVERETQSGGGSGHEPEGSRSSWEKRGFEHDPGSGLNRIGMVTIHG